MLGHTKDVVVIEGVFTGDWLDLRLPGISIGPHTEARDTCMWVLLLGARRSRDRGHETFVYPVGPRGRLWVDEDQAQVILLTPNSRPQ